MLAFFAKKGKVKYSGIFFLGFFVILLRFSFIGGLLQLYALFLLFRSFVPFIIDWLFSVPGIGPFMSSLP